MVEPPPSTDQRSITITDLNMDALVHCASYLNLQDLSNMAMSCTYFNRVAYSDSIWQSLFRERWPQQVPSSFSQISGAREAYLARNTALQQFKFVDPQVADCYTHSKPYDQLFLDKNNIIFSQGPLIHMIRIDEFLNGKDPLVTLRDHHARITCMRLFSLSETSLFRSETQRNENVLVTSSCDHSIRLWWKGCCQRCFRGHNGAVSTLSDKLLGDDTAKVFGSGGVDGTVRLWSLSSSGKRGKHALKATLYGHERPVALMSVAGHKTSLLVSISKDSKVRVWDTTTSSSVRSSSCVGMTSVPGAPVSMKCHEALLYVAAGSSVSIIDLRTMQKVCNIASHQSNLYSLEVMPSKSLICTGGTGRALLWDIRSCNSPKAEPIIELDGHMGPVTRLHMDPYKIVTGGPEDNYVNIWEAETGTETNSLICCSPDIFYSSNGCSAMSVDGCRIVTVSCGEELSVLRYRDFNNATCVAASDESRPVSKFWGLQSYSDTDESDG